jgi:putative endonuclease
MWNVYILQSQKNKKYYVGCTNNIERRLLEHNLGQNSSTKYSTPWIIIHTESFKDQKDAYEREKKIKSYKGGKAFKNLLRL